MIPRIRERLKALEDRIMPPPQSRVFTLAIDEQSPLASDEQLAAFKAEKCVAPHDHLVVVTFA
jgi:hypothetical protein